MAYRIQAENLAALFQKSAEKYNDLPAFATRESALQWTPITYKELYAQGLEVATGLIAMGVQARDHIGHFGDNRLEWILADCAVQLSGAADVPRGRDVTDAELEYIIEHAEIKFAFVETEELQNRLLDLKSKLPLLQQIVLLDPKANAKEGVKTLLEVKEMGAKLRKQNDRRVEERMAGIKPDDLFTLIYTSGTTGKPKGVMLTHANMVSQVKNLPGKHNMNDRILSVLPIWHVFERVVEMYTIGFGGCTFYSSIQNLGDDMRNIEPTFMASAPRLWEKLHERIIQNIKSSHPVRQILFHIAYFLSRHYTASVYYINNKNLKTQPEHWLKKVFLLPFHILRFVLIIPWYGFFNAAVLERIRLGAGGSLGATISGGGALPIHIDRFFNNVGIPVLEGYGMTESSPVISVRAFENLVVGTVGPALPETEIQIVDIETGDVLFPNIKKAHNGRGVRGEIWVKGPQVMKGYFKDAELTNKTIVDGWLRTGDLGMMTHNDCLKILGRSKSTIVLLSGENVEPEPIEMSLQQSEYIEHCMVVGQDKKFIGVIIVPSVLKFRQEGFKVKTVAELVDNNDVQKIIRAEIKRLNSSQNGFRHFEQVKDFRMLNESFEVGNELTNLFKIKRHIVEKKYNDVINDLFKTA
ncbi:MAG: long-chain fatty acid--CoA ligase [Paludibacter sp.]|nr:long-chain fatty acid--CoA ligase [Paludibacter sp.]